MREETIFYIKLHLVSLLIGFFATVAAGKPLWYTFIFYIYNFVAYYAMREVEKRYKK